MTIDKEQNSCVVVSGTQEASNSKAAVVSVIGDKEAANGLQNSGQRPIAMFLDIFRCNQCYRGRRLFNGLQMSRSGIYLGVSQLIECQFRQVGLCSLCKAAATSYRTEDDDSEKECTASATIGIRPTCYS